MESGPSKTMSPQVLSETLSKKIEKLSAGHIEIMNPYQVLQLALLQHTLGILVTQSHQLEEILRYTKLTDGEKQEAREKDAKAQ